MNDDWMDELRRADGALRPTGPAGDVVRRTVARRRRRRTLVGLAGGTGVVLAGVGLALIPGTLLDTGSDRSPDAGRPTATADRAVLFDCPTGREGLAETPPPIKDLAQQQRTVDRLAGLTRPEFSLRHAQTSPLGVIALVEGDESAAMRYLEPEGVTHVQPWDPSGPEIGLDPTGQVSQVLQWEIDPVVGEINRATRSIPGLWGLRYWTEAAAVVVQWKAPVPEQVRALEDRRWKSGVRVYVRATAYSRADLERAQAAFDTALRAGRLSVPVSDWSMTAGCADGSGLVVGVVPERLGERRAQLQEEIGAVVSMPVKVVAEERPVELGTAPLSPATPER